MKKSVIIIIIILLSTTTLYGRNVWEKSGKKKLTISGDMLYRIFDIYLDINPKKKVDTTYRQFGARIKFNYKLNKKFNLVARTTISNPEKPYQRYYRLSIDPFQIYFDQLYLKFKNKRNNYYFGRYPINFYHKNGTSMLFSPNINFEGIGGEFNNSIGKFHCGFARIAEGRNIDFRGDSANKEDLIRYGGFNFPINKKSDLRFTLFDFNLNSNTPFPLSHAGGGIRFYAYAKDYRIADFSLKLKLKKFENKYPVTFITEFLKNLYEVKFNNGWATQLVIGKKCSRKGDWQLILKYAKIEPYSIIGYYTPYGKTTNTKGGRINLNIGISKNVTITLCWANFLKENQNFPGPYNKFNRKLLLTRIKF